MGTVFDQIHAEQQPAQSSGNIFDQIHAEAMAPGTPQEREFLSKNSDYIYVRKDPKFPNRQEGIYPKNEAGLNDPQMEHHPVDLNFGRNTATYGLGSAAAIGGAATLGPELAGLGAKAVQKVAPLAIPAAASYAINEAKQLPIVGPVIKRIPMAELIPWLAVGGKGGKSSAETAEAEAAGSASPNAPSQVAPVEGEAASTPINDAGKFTKAKPNPPYTGARVPNAMVPVESGNVGKVGYHADSETMFIEYKSGDVYEYRGVPQKIFPIRRRMRIRRAASWLATSRAAMTRITAATFSGSCRLAQRRMLAPRPKRGR